MNIINRRDFFKGSALLGSTILLSQKKVSAAETEYRFPVLQGATSYTKTQISVMAAEEIVIDVAGARVEVERIQKEYSVWNAYRVVADDLVPGKTYELTISSPEGVLLDTRTFSTLRPGVARAKIALASCMRDTRAEFQAPMWKALADQEPDLIFLLGDNVYVDDETGLVSEVSEERIWRRYVETRLTLDLYHYKKLVPTLATWDDHDFGKNNTYGATPWREPSSYVFRTLYAQDPIMPEVTWGPGIATSYSAHGQRFFLMDNRSFREHPYIGKYHWGLGQEEWLFGNLNAAPSPGWIFSGSQIFGGYRTGWAYEENHPGQLRRNLERLKKIKAPVLFGSGDVHYSEIMKVEDDFMGYETIEITSSSMHSNAKEPQRGNKRRITSVGEYNFVMATVDVVPERLQLNLRSHGRDGKQYFEVDNIRIGR